MNCYLPEIGNVPALARLSISAGDSWQRTFTLKTGSADGVPLDLTGSVIEGVVLDNLGGMTVFLPTIDTSDAIDGSFTLSINRDDSQMLTPGVYDGDAAGQYWLLVRKDGVTILKFVLQCLPGEQI